MTNLERRRLTSGAADAGSAILEFIFVALAVMMPLVYLLVIVSRIQQSQVAVQQAAREAGRAFATSRSASMAASRARTAVRLAMFSLGLPDDASINFVDANASCSSPPIIPTLQPGGEFTVCVSRHVVLPAIPDVFAGRGIEIFARYTVLIDLYRTGSPS